jgi:hypothetical protein
MNLLLAIVMHDKFEKVVLIVLSLVYASYACRSTFISRFNDLIQ